jgi:hypothetical protein
MAKQVEKLSVSMPQPISKWLKHQAHGERTSVSAILTRMAREEMRRQALGRYLKTVGADQLPDEDVEAARQEFYAAIKSVPE